MNMKLYLLNDVAKMLRKRPHQVVIHASDISCWARHA
jgi:hypothetical protein